MRNYEMQYNIECAIAAAVVRLSNKRMNTFIYLLSVIKQLLSSKVYTDTYNLS